MTDQSSEVEVTVVSDEDVQERREYVEDLRQAVAEEEQKRVERETSASNAVALQELDAEAAGLEARLAAAKLANDNAEGSDPAPLVAAREEEERARHQAEAAAEQARLDAENARKQAEAEREAREAAARQAAGDTDDDTDKE